MQYHFLQLVLGLTFLFLVVDVRSQKACGKQRMSEGRSGSPWPWMVAISGKIGKNSDYHPLCSGFLIDHIHVITVAHCVKDNKFTHYLARIGHVDWTRGEKYSIAKVMIHENYAATGYYDDIAMLRLSRPVTKQVFNPICLPNEEVRRFNLDNKRATLLGWKRKSSGENMTILHELKGIMVVSNEQCEQVYQKTSSNFSLFSNGIDNKTMCAGFPEGETEICGGAGGGPLMIQRKNRWYVVGINSFVTCEIHGTPNRFIRVSGYLEWIWKNAFMY